MICVQVCKFPIENIADSSVTVIVGQRRSGKSSTADYILKKLREGGMEDVIEFHGRFSLSERSGHDCHYANEELLTEVIEKRTIELSRSADPQQMCILIDDDVGTKFFRSDAMLDLFHNCHRLRINVFVIVQDFVRIHSELREKIDYVLVQSQLSVHSTSLLVRECVNDDYSLKGFRCMLQKLTESKVVVIDRAHGSAIYYAEITDPKLSTE